MKEKVVFKNGVLKMAEPETAYEKLREKGKSIMVLSIMLFL